MFISHFPFREYGLMGIKRCTIKNNEDLTRKFFEKTLYLGAGGQKEVLLGGFWCPREIFMNFSPKNMNYCHYCQRSLEKSTKLRQSSSYDNTNVP